MVKMIADRDFPYRMRSLKKGEAFEAEDEHVALFTRIGHAHVAERSQTYHTRVMTPRRMRARSVAQ